MLETEIRDDTILVGLIWANNETGVIQPVDAIADLVRGHGCVFFSDSTQAIGKIPVSADQADLLTISAHKFYGPKGFAGRRQRGGRIEWVRGLLPLRCRCGLRTDTLRREQGHFEVLA